MRDANGNLIIANRLVAFRVVDGKHDGENLAKIAFGILKEAGILHQSGMWTLDSASNNGTFMFHLGRLIAAEPGIVVEFDAEGNRIRCFPHVINIATQTILAELKENPRDPVIASESPMSHAKLVAYADALESDPVGGGRRVVAACRASGQRRSDLKIVIRQGNATKHWPVEGGVLRTVQLLRDCETRWSSTYNMSDRVIELYPAVQCFLRHPQQLSLAHLLFTEDQFQVLNDIQLVLSAPHLAQELLSAEKTPTLSMALPAFELLLKSWLQMQQTLPELAHYIGVGIAKIQEYVNKGRKSRVYALAMIINPTMKMHWIEENWPVSDALNAEEWMIEVMTAFATARRHENAKVAARRVPGSQSIHRPSPTSQATAAQASGFTRLANLTNVSRRIVSLPRISSDCPTLNSSPAQLSLVPSPLPSPQFVQPSPPIPPILSPAEEAELERQALEDDRRAAIREFSAYKNEPLVSSNSSQPLNLVRYWDVNSEAKPLLFKVACDVLPVQASSVPCERVFSSSAETDTKRRNRLQATLFEALQLMKYSYKQDRLSFTDDVLAKEEDYTIEGTLTEAAIRELMQTGKTEELADLLRNMTAPDEHAEVSTDTR
ncbi:Dimer-Tnp-hAT domain-containing protein [Mycena venus]|uniref:Dimer-Tnp-hAT domain-containing protein n=1 Tax=Mycena venus TaxID=2733690 RepID=A0A8H7DE53_9AGAR|nr:Dimer-Tnp-hAT domain-containing protein [Mycena venus]